MSNCPQTMWIGFKPQLETGSDAGPTATQQMLSGLFHSVMVPPLPSEQLSAPCHSTSISLADMNLRETKRQVCSPYSDQTSHRVSKHHHGNPFPHTSQMPMKVAPQGFRVSSHSSTKGMRQRREFCPVPGASQAITTVSHEASRCNVAASIADGDTVAMVARAGRRSNLIP